MAETREICLPLLGDGQEEARLVEWRVRPGERLTAGTIVAVVETEKATVEIPAEVEGTVLDLLIPEGQVVPVGSVLALVRPAAGGGVRPAARRLEQDLGLDLRQILPDGMMPDHSELRRHIEAARQHLRDIRSRMDRDLTLAEAPLAQALTDLETTLDALYRSEAELRERRREVTRLHSEQQETLRRYREAVARYQALLEAAVDGILTIDERGTILSANPAVERIFGYREEELIGENVKILMSSEDRDHHDGYLEHYRRTGERRIIGIGREVVGQRQNGETFPVDLAVGELRVGDQVGFVGILRDLSERKAIEEALERERDLAESLEERFHQAQKMEAVGRLAGGVAHDFNTLLGSIIGYSERLLERLPKDPDLQRSVRQIHRGATRGAALTRQLLTFSRRQVVKPVNVDLNALLTNMADMLGHLIGSDTVLTQEFAPNLGPVRADPVQLEQVVMNLAVNAVDAMPQGGTLALRTRRADHRRIAATWDTEVPEGWYVILEVQDTGHGLDDEVRDHIFEPFFTTKALGKGTGLGLSTVYGIVQQSHGGIRVESQPGQGACFAIYLPEVQGEAEAPEAPELQPPAEARGSEVVLLVEDDEMFLELLAEVLREAGYTVLITLDPARALEIAAGHDRPVDLLISDIVMPGMTGNQLAQRLVEAQPQLKVLLMSGHTDEALEVRGAVTTGMHFLQKPFSTHRLVQVVREILDGAAAGGG